jgi:hypothetical protein
MEMQSTNYLQRFPLLVVFKLFLVFVHQSWNTMCHTNTLYHTNKILIIKSYYFSWHSLAEAYLLNHNIYLFIEASVSSFR